MYQILRTGMLVLLVASVGTLHSQVLKSGNCKKIYLDVNSSGRWEASREKSRIGIDEIRVYGQFFLTPNWSLGVMNKTWFNKNAKSRNDVTQAFLQYSNFIKNNNKAGLFRLPTMFFVKAGWLEWIPRFTDPKLIVENLDRYRFPESYYGLDLNVVSPLDAKNRYVMHFNGLLMDVLDQNTIEVHSAYIRVTQPIYNKISFCGQLGKMTGSKHLINHAYLQYRPVIGKLVLFIKAGKLPALDQTPYGAEVGFERSFRYISLGAYYQRRFDQQSNPMVGDKQIFGFSVRILKPKLLKDIFDAYNFIYDTNNEVLRFNIPVMTTEINF